MKKLRIRGGRRLGRRPRPVGSFGTLEHLEARALLSGLTIAQENQLTGTPQSQWDIVSGAGNPNLQGFATDISVDTGQTISFKIKDVNQGAYNINIYRAGYYQGDGARLVATIPSSQALQINQPAPISDPTSGEVDAGNWSVAASWTAVDPTTNQDATSGVYFANLVPTNTKEAASQIIFIVRDDNSHSNILFQTSDGTWQAYNTWGAGSTWGGNSFGGNSLYQGSFAGTSNSQTPGRAYAVSYNRPLTIDGVAGGYGTYNSFWHGEDAMVYWLEENGYDVSYFTDVDSSRYGNLILNHNIYMDCGHDEYVSGPERANIQAALNAGVNLALMSGNEIYWKTRWANSLDTSATPYRTEVCYKESTDNQVLDPQDPPTWTGTWRDLRFSPPADGGQPENALIGNLYMDDRTNVDLGIPLQVPAADASLWFWKNTAVANLRAGQVATLGQYIVGYEVNEDLDNGFRPAGVMDLSSTTFSSTSRVIVPWGTVVGSGTGTHSLTLYRAPSGALVFGAATVQWDWGLGYNDLGPINEGVTEAPDPSIEQATVNLLANMSAQPATLIPGLVAATASTDHTPPTSKITSPSPGASFPNGTAVTITGTASDTGGGVVAGVEVSVDGGKTWHPATPSSGAAGWTSWSYTWAPNTSGAVTIESRAVDDSGNLETPSAGVTVLATGPYSLFSNATVPGTLNDADTGNVEVGVKFTSDVAANILGVRFYKGTQNTGTHVGSLWTSTGTLLAQVTFTNETASGWQQALFSSPVAINPNTVYVVSYHASNGHYSSDDYYFYDQAVNNGTLHAPANGVDGPQGVFVYSSSSAFPTNTYAGANYYVDVVYQPTGTVTPPTVPTNLTATGSQATASLSWTASTSSIGVAGYDVYRSTTSGFTPSNANLIGTTKVTSYTDSPLAAGTYYYLVEAYDTDGNLSQPSNQASAVVAPDTTPPTPPTNLAATVAAASVGLTWTASTDNVGVAGYDVYRSTTSGFTPSSANLIGTSKATSYTDPTLAAGKYYYLVAAYDAAGNLSPPSNQASAAVVPPTVPTNLSATVTGTSVGLSWTASTDSGIVAGYDVYRSTTSGFTPSSANLIGTAAATSYTDGGLAGGTYYYLVEAYDAAGNLSPPSNQATATIVPQPLKLIQDATNGTTTSGSTITLAFPSSTKAGDFLIVTGAASSPRETLAISDSAGDTFAVALGPVTDTAQDATEYVWYVANAKGGADTVTLTPSSADALEVHISEWTGISSASPVDQTASATGSGTSLSSGSKTTTQAGDLIYGYAFVGNTASAGSGFTALTAINGDETEYRVQAAAGSVAATFTQSPSGAWSALMVAFKPVPAAQPPTPPTNLTANGSVATATLSWAASTSSIGVAGYDVYRSTISGFTPSSANLIGTTATTSYTDSSLAAGTYYYLVEAYDTAGNLSGPSNQASAVVTSNLTPPTNLTATGAIGTASLSWTAATDSVTVTGYTIYRSTTSGFTPGPSNQVGTSTTTSYTDSGLAAGTYYYLVTAHDAAGNVSAPSNQASAAVTADTTPPTAPTNLTATAGSSSVALSWTASTDNVGVTGYTIYRSTTSGFTPGPSNQVGTSTTTSYTDSGLAAGTYYYLVTAHDAAGNVSAPSNQATATIAATVAIKVVQDASNEITSAATKITLAFPSSTKAGDFLIVTGIASVPRENLTISDSAGDTFVTAIGPVADTAQNATEYIWYVAGAKGGADTVTLTPAAAAVLEIHISEWTGISSSSPVDQTASATGKGTSISSGAKTTTQAGELIYGYVLAGGSAVAGSGFTGLSPIDGDVDEYQVQAAAGSIAAKFTQSPSSNWSALMVTFKPATAGASVTLGTLSLGGTASTGRGGAAGYVLQRSTTSGSTPSPSALIGRATAAHPAAIAPGPAPSPTRGAASPSPSGLARVVPLGASAAPFAGSLVAADPLIALPDDLFASADGPGLGAAFGPGSVVDRIVQSLMTPDASGDPPSPFVDPAPPDGGSSSGYPGRRRHGLGL